MTEIVWKTGLRGVHHGIIPDLGIVWSIQYSIHRNDPLPYKLYCKLPGIKGEVACATIDSAQERADRQLETFITKLTAATVDETQDQEETKP